MKELTGNELKKSIKEQLIIAVKNLKNPVATITFRFEIDKDYNPTEKIEYVFGDLHYKKVDLGSCEDKKVFDIIVNNFYYDHFAFIDNKIKVGETKCRGFGEYWGEDKVKITYRRLSD